MKVTEYLVYIDALQYQKIFSVQFTYEQDEEAILATENN